MTDTPTVCTSQGGALAGGAELQALPRASAANAVADARLTSTLDSRRLNLPLARQISLAVE
jgi:hypothetical protein